MLAVEREEKIIQLLNERGSVKVAELSERFQVTEETIRRDLARLEREGRLRRSHGGALSLKQPPLEIPYFKREIANVPEKKSIAKKAVEMVEEDDFILLDASSTAWYMAQLLANRPLTVLTNSIKVAIELSSKKQIRVISTGGLLSSGSLSFVGPLAEKSLEPYHVNKAFISCQGLHLEWGLSETNEWQARVKQRMIAISERTILLVDHTKIGIRAFAHLAPLADIDCIITDSNANLSDFDTLDDWSGEIYAAAIESTS